MIKFMEHQCHSPNCERVKCSTPIFWTNSYFNEKNADKTKIIKAQSLIRIFSERLCLMLY